jgi:hypothetical protein
MLAWVVVYFRTCVPYAHPLPPPFTGLSTVILPQEMFSSVTTTNPRYVTLGLGVKRRRIVTTTHRTTPTCWFPFAGPTRTFWGLENSPNTQMYVARVGGGGGGCSVACQLRSAYSPSWP